MMHHGGARDKTSDDRNAMYLVPKRVGGLIDIFSNMILENQTTFLNDSPYHKLSSRKDTKQDLRLWSSHRVLIWESNVNFIIDISNNMHTRIS